MKKTVYTFLTLFIVSALFISCVPEEETELSVPVQSDTQSVSNDLDELLEPAQTEEQPTETVSSDVWTLFFSPEALSSVCEPEDLINNNPIDKSRALEGEQLTGTTFEMVGFLGEYIDLWQAEIDNAMDILRENLPPESIEKLEIAQESWREYIKNDTSIAVDCHIQRSGTGSILPILSGQRFLTKTRNRALELIEYCYLVTGEYEFVFEA